MRQHKNDKIILKDIFMKMKNIILFLTVCLFVNLAFAQQRNDKQLFSVFDKILSKKYKNNETGATDLVAPKRANCLLESLRYG